MASTNNDGEEEQKKKPFFYYVKRIYPFFLCFVEIPILTYNSIPCPVSPEPFSISPVQPSFEVNSALTKAKRIIDGELDRPHSLVVDKDHLYTGTQDGFVNDVWKGTVRPLAHFGKLNCV
ncbi:uncharacterized protein LOC106011747 [Aplysia californica]|uniref:Uncharacterized protein LOC106011747 n=1 Tax=Aplysia californica TaxID=6500 RepID=A0ABM0ZZS4_APLCA|nr:uncharacterized protein LOC106011747 [Aplysia californica]